MHRENKFSGYFIKFMGWPFPTMQLNFLNDLNIDL